MPKDSSSEKTFSPESARKKKFFAGLIVAILGLLSWYALQTQEVQTYEADNTPAPEVMTIEEQMLQMYDNREQQEEIASIIERPVRENTVRIQRGFMEQGSIMYIGEQGSGVILDELDLDSDTSAIILLTANHVVDTHELGAGIRDDIQFLKIELPDKPALNAEVIACEQYNHPNVDGYPTEDLALCYLQYSAADVHFNDLVSITRYGKVSPGDQVYTYGYPGLFNTIGGKPVPFASTGKVIDTPRKHAVASLLGGHGMSGAPVLFENRIIGLYTAGFGYGSTDTDTTITLLPPNFEEWYADFLQRQSAQQTAR